MKAEAERLAGRGTTQSLLFACGRMIRAKLKRGSLLALIWGAAALGWPQNLSPSFDSQNVVPFEVNRNFGSILIKARVNGQPATLVVDTGSSHTILSSDLLQVRPLALPRAYDPAKGSGYVGSAGWAKATVEVGTNTWRDRRILVMNDFQDMSNSMKQKVDGILGEDLLREFEVVVIDFKRQRLVFSR